MIEEFKLNPGVIIPVDLFGLPANYPKINDLARRYNMRVLEEGAQGLGGRLKRGGRAVGCSGRIIKDFSDHEIFKEDE